ncbi:unnamed protein product [Prunus armeniaca]|uniref:SET domain-containing protein n=1 Tax=Prunus armeniaca TaxID=36596 RepID=A0A6J5TZE0_PRUAR|nr:unnamed protein product [Prunus armeniaca]
MHLRKKGKLVNMRKQLGPILGVEVGDEFRNRAELIVAGLHHNFRRGIEYMKKDGKILATSIVNSGRYANHVGSPDILFYSGEGGNPRVECKKPKDQTLERGNLALKNSMEVRTHVRVIRAVKHFEVGTCAKKRSFTTYVYDGLYKVKHFWQERGEFGKLVFKYLLKRIPRQPIIKWEKVSKQSKKPMVSKDIICKNDISEGKEMMPIRVVNAIDSESHPAFNYTRYVIYPNFFMATKQRGCDCLHGCLECKSCPCVMNTGGVCSPNNTIIDRKSLFMTAFKLEVFRTKSKGWGVRSRSYIPCGSFICEYVGEILQEKEVKRRRGSDEYFFWTNGKFVDHAFRDASQHVSFPMLPNFFGDGFVIDATQHGNVGRFVNHSSSPNLFAQSILYDHDDVRIPHMMLFAKKSIPPNQELTYDYSSRVGKIVP